MPPPPLRLIPSSFASSSRARDLSPIPSSSSSSTHPSAAADADVQLLLQPASPSFASPAAFNTAPTSPSDDAAPNLTSTPPPIVSPLIAPSTLAQRRAAGKNKKQLSLLVVPSPSGTTIAPALASSRSLPPSPSAIEIEAAEGGEERDRTIGRLMMGDAMAMRGRWGMERRPSFVGDSAVRVVKANEAGGSVEDFPYASGPREIIPNVLLGSEANAADSRLLKSKGIEWVLNVAKEVKCPWTRQGRHGVDDGKRKKERPKFVRSMVSTPNLAGSSSSVSVQPLPTLKNISSIASEGVFFEEPGLRYLHLPWSHDESDLVEDGKFDVAFAFIDKALNAGGRVLVHCQCGISRSATVVIAYLMREALKSLEAGETDGTATKGMHDIYEFVKSKSEWIGPNLSLVFQLVTYERALRGDVPPPLGHEEGGSAGSSDDMSHLSTPGNPPLASEIAKLGLGFDEDNVTMSPPASAVSFVSELPSRKNMQLELSPLPAHVSQPPPTPFISTPARQRRTSSSSSTSSSGSFAFPAAPRATVVTSTPTVAAFAPSPAQLSLGGFGAPQTKSERRASHQRVFSVPSVQPFLGPS